MKCTPGPWNVGSYPDDDAVYVVIKNKTICSLDQGYYEKTINEEQCKANAHLIAAAPEMLEALEALNYRLTELNSEGKLDGLGLDSLVRQAFNASEKARGDVC